jgi:hypothetical protein
MGAAKPKKGSFKDMVCCLLDTAIPCFGEPVCYQPSVGGNIDITAVFDEDFIAIDPDTEEVISSNAPRIGIKVSDLPFLPTDKDHVVIGDRRFKVTDSQEDGQGGSTIFLNEVES